MTPWIGIVALLSPGVVSAPPDWDALRLPKAVRLEVLSFTSQSGDKPFDKIIAEIGPDWVRSEQHLAEGSFGFRLYDFTYDTLDESLLFNADSKRGSRSQTFREARISRVENLVTPIGLIRVAKMVQERGDPVESRVEGNLIIHSFSASRSGFGPTEVVVDPEASVIREVRFLGTIKSGLITYDDWEALPDGTHHPKTVHFTASMNGKVAIDSTERVQQMTLLDPARGPTPYTLPALAQITDEIRGFVADGTGKSIGSLPPTETGTAPTASNSRMNLVAILVGAILFAGAGALLQVRRAMRRSQA